MHQLHVHIPSWLFRAIAGFAFVLGSTTLNADHHAEPATGPHVVEVFECSLNPGFTLSDVLEFGRGPFANFSKTVNNSGATYLWEPIAISPPYDQAQFRWVNHYPSWASYDEGNQAWRAPAQDALRAKILELTTCKLPTFLMRHDILRPSAIERPARLLTGRCALNENQSMSNALDYIGPARSKAVADAAGADRGQFLMTPHIAMSANFDFLNVLFGNHKEIAALLDGGRTGAVQEANRAFNSDAAPYQCGPWALHESHLISSN